MLKCIRNAYDVAVYVHKTAQAVPKGGGAGAAGGI